MNVNGIKLLLKVTREIWSRYNECSAEDIILGFRRGWLKVVQKNKVITDIKKIRAIAERLSQTNQ